LAIFWIFGGGDAEVSSDFNTETDTDGTFHFISLQTILAFLMGFGWMGYAALKSYNFGQLVAFGSAFGVGLLFLLGTAYLMSLVRKLEKTVKKDKATALDKIGKAYTDFAPKGQGRVEIEIAGQLTVADAVNTTEDEIKAFDQIKVVKVENELLFIEKVV
jgi:membrane protein implicated in regulation of membrane protease activity